MTPVLVDSNFVLGVAADSPERNYLSGETPAFAASEAVLIINTSNHGRPKPTYMNRRSPFMPWYRSATNSP